MASKSSRQQGSKAPPLDKEEVDPSYDWQENAHNFVLRMHLSGFRKQDFKVQVDGAGRLTVRDQRTNADGSHSRLNKVFQLPAAANLEDISGRFEAGVLTLTVPKKVQPGPGKQQHQEAANNKQGKLAEASSKPPPKAEAEAERKEDMASAPVEEATTTKKPGAAEQAEAKTGEPDQRQAAMAAGSAAPTPTAADKKNKDQAAAAPAADTKQQAAAPPAHPEERAKRRADAEEEKESKRAKAAKPAHADEAPPRRGFRELRGRLAGSEWAEGLLDTVKKNREVIAVAVAAFSLGLFVSSRLCSRN
ncbi:hypothetical protein BS78_09G257700 [Paspalum vaginatum]|nr:hypothetical protein BS78_09G257700 [Paspalum vaginatum]